MRTLAEKRTDLKQAVLRSKTGAPRDRSAPLVSIGGDNSAPVTVVVGTLQAPVVVVTGGAPCIRLDPDPEIPAGLPSHLEVPV